MIKSSVRNRYFTVRIENKSCGMFYLCCVLAVYNRLQVRIEIGCENRKNHVFEKNLRFCIRLRSPGERSFAGRMVNIFEDSPGECGAKRPKWVASLTSFAGRKIRLAGRIELEVEIFLKLVLIITF